MHPNNKLPWLLERINWQGDECLIWPFNRNDRGYGQLKAYGKIRRAHRVMCVLAHGEPDDRKLQASHTCGNGHLGCVNPRHLRWSTNSENQLERWRVHGRTAHNTGGPKGIISPANAKKLMASYGKISIEEAAKTYGIKRGAVNYWFRKARTAQIGR